VPILRWQLGFALGVFRKDALFDEAQVPVVLFLSVPPLVAKLDVHELAAPALDPLDG